MKRRPKAVCVLVSGGLDSAVLTADRLLRGEEVFPLYVRCGLRWEDAEIASLRRYLAALARRRWPGRLRPLTVATAGMRSLLGRHWALSGGGKVPAASANWDSVFLPGRNLMLLTEAGIFCAAHGIPVVAQALLKGNPFEDATPGFRRRMERVLADSLAFKVRVEAPYARLTKEQVRARIPGLPLHLTFSCLKPSGSGQQCGRCSKCAERLGRGPSAGQPDGMDRAAALFNEGRYEAAARAFQAAPDSVRARLFEGHAWRSAGRLDEAERAFARALTLAPASKEAAEGMARLRRLRREGHTDLRESVLSLLRAGRPAEACKAAERLQAAGPALADTRALWDPWRSAPGAAAAAVPRLKALAARSSSPWPSFFLAWSDVGRPESPGHFDAAAARCPWMSLEAGWSRLMCGEAELAVPRLERALKAVPRDWKARGFLGEARLCLGNAPAARRELALAVQEAGPERAQALAWQGALELWLGSYKRALSLLETARAEGADLAWTWSGAALLMLGRRREALARLDEAIARQPRDIEALVWRGEAKRLLGDRPGALADLAKAGNSVWALLNAVLCGRTAAMDQVAEMIRTALAKRARSDDPVVMAKHAFAHAKGWRRDDYAQAFWL